MSGRPDLRAKLRTIPVMPRRRPPRMVDGRLSVAWASTRSDGADLYVVGGDGTCSPDRHLIMGAFCSEPIRMRIRDGVIDHVYEKSLAEELIDRGYDITTLRFSIQKLPKPATDHVPQIQHPPASADS